MAHSNNKNLLVQLDCDEISEHEAFRIAITAKDLDQIKELVSYGVRSDDYHLLSICVENQCRDILEYLVKENVVEINQTSYYEKEGLRVEPTASGMAAVIAAEKGDTQTIDFLLESGASLSGTHDRASLADISNKNMMASESAADLLFERETFCHKKSLCKVFNAASTISDYKHEVVNNNNNSNGTTGLILAARANCFEQVITACFANDISENNPPFTLDDLTKTDKNSMSVLKYLIYHNSLEQVFNPKLWLKAPNALQKLLSDLPQGLIKESDKKNAISHANQHRVAQHSVPAVKRRRKPGM